MGRDETGSLSCCPSCHWRCYFGCFVQRAWAPPATVILIQHPAPAGTKAATSLAVAWPAAGKQQESNPHQPQQYRPLPHGLQYLPIQAERPHPTGRRRRQIDRRQKGRSAAPLLFSARLSYLKSQTAQGATEPRRQGRAIPERRPRMCSVHETSVVAACLLASCRWA